MSDSTIGVGVIGYGYWGPNLLRNFVREPRAQAVICCDQRPERLAQAKAQYPTVAVTEDPQAVISHPDVDAVVIATPVATHHPLARESLLAGKHVLVEKPLTSTVEEAEDLVRLAAERGSTLMVDHTFVYTNPVRKIKSLVESGELGELYYFDSVRVNLGMFQSDVNVVWDLAPHDISILAFLVPESPTSVSAIGRAHVRQGQEDIAYLTINYANDFVAHVHVNWLAPVKIRRTLIGGSKKMVIYDHLDAMQPIKVYDKGVDVNDDVHQALIEYRIGDMVAPYLENVEALWIMAQHFVDCVLGGDTPVTDGRAGLDVVRVIEAAQTSVARQGQEQSL